MNTRQKVHDILEHFDTVMLVTTAPDGQSHARPMQVAELEPDGDVWLISSAAASQAEEVAHDASVLLVCQEKSTQFLALRGRARLVDDRQRLRRIWKETFQTWFPDGPETPDLTLIAIEPVSAEYWDNTGVNRLKQLWESAKVLAGEPPDPRRDESQHGRTRM